MTPERVKELRALLAAARDASRDTTRSGERRHLDGNDAWEWYANDGDDLMDALDETLAALEAAR